jgi:hypothetical protein
VYRRAVSKPTVRLTAGGPIVVGRASTVTIEVVASEATRVEYIALRIEGQQGWSIGHGKSRVRVDANLPEREVRLMDAGELASGSVTAFDVDLRLPRGTAPTHDVSPAHAALRLRVHVSLPWRIDVRSKFEAQVRLAPPERVERSPVVLSSAGRRTGAREPRLEVSLASSHLVAGEMVVGSVALFNLDNRAWVDLALVPVLRLYGRGKPRDRRGVPLRLRHELPADHGGRSIPFSFALPARMTPTFESVTHALSWRLEVSSDSVFGRDVKVAHPVHVVDAAAAEVSLPLQAAPRLADEWVTTLFTMVAAREGWQLEAPPANDGDDADRPPAIVRALAGGARVRIDYVYRGDEGMGLRARVEHPPLGLGLTVVHGSTLRHLFWRDVEAGVPAWDRAHLVTARFPAQAAPFLAAAVPALVAAEATLGTMVRWDDHALSFERALPAIRDADVAPTMVALERLAAALVSARATIALPPGVGVELPAWHALASWLDGDLAIGDLTLTGTLAGAPVLVTLEWEDGRAVRVRASVGDGAIADEALRAVALKLPQPLADVLSARIPEAVVDCVARWPTDIVDVEVAGGVATGELALAADDTGAGTGTGSDTGTGAGSDAGTGTGSDAGLGRVPVDAGRVRALVAALRDLLTAVAPPAAPAL